MDRLGEEGFKKLKELTELYFVVKKIMVYSEEIILEKSPDLQALNEFRNSFDHLMRALAARFEIKKVPDLTKYTYKNIDKAFGHVYRAAYDILDWTSLNLRDYIGMELKNFSLPTIKEVSPDYYQTMRPRIEEINRDIAEFRLGKDVEDANIEGLKQYVARLEELHDIYQNVLLKETSLIDHERRLQKEGRKIFWGVTLRDLIIAIIGIIIGVILKIIFK